MNAWVCAGTDSKREFDAVLAVLPVSQTVVPVMIVITNHVRTLLVIHVPIGQAGLSGLNVPPRAALVKDGNKEPAMEKIFLKVFFRLRDSSTFFPVGD